MTAKRGKKYKANAAKVDRQARYDLMDALNLLKQTASAKFDETVDVAIKLGVDAKKSDQMVRGVAHMPHGTGRQVRVLVFAKGEKAEEATRAGADFVGAEELVQKIQGGWLDFDKAIATPDMMAKIGPIAKVLGPRGLMPNPKVGTVTVDVAKAVADQKGGSVEFRIEKAGIVHALFGKASFTAEQLADNFRALLDQVVRAKPSTSKGNYIQSVSFSSTMGPGIKLDLTKTLASSVKE